MSKLYLYSILIVLLGLVVRLPYQVNTRTISDLPLSKRALRASVGKWQPQPSLQSIDNIARCTKDCCRAMADSSNVSAEAEVGECFSLPWRLPGRVHGLPGRCSWQRQE